MYLNKPRNIERNVLNNKPRNMEWSILNAKPRNIEGLKKNYMVRLVLLN